MLAASLAALPLGCGLWQLARAADPPVDAGLLEFLGSVDSDDADWHQYLGKAGGTPAPRRVHSDPADPPASQQPADGGPVKGAGSSAPSDSPPRQNGTPGSSQPGSSSGSNGHASPPPVNQT
jgi:hypothetical protein